ncbi:hypothetical protein CJK43_002720 [Salmonella enterica subsp. enterica serovar Miami]|nr:hypothetical protein [Salmonella enterica]EDV2388652.1 hypothetical protein [Salmonella enterica subsp. enterica serovar Miami]
MTCEICIKQPRGRRDKALPCMVSKPEKDRPYVSIQGRGTEESYYVCSECGHEWLHETGNCGQGWQP